MIHNVWIAKESGECLFHRRYGNITAEENIVTSFLSAMDSFASEFAGAAVSFKTTNYRFFFRSIKGAKLIVASDAEDTEAPIRRSMDIIANTVDMSYSSIMPEWEGSLMEFEPLISVVDAEFQDSSSWHKLMFQLRTDVNTQVFSGCERKIVSLLKFKGKATLGDIMRYMNLSRNEAENAAKSLLGSEALHMVDTLHGSDENGDLLDYPSPPSEMPLQPTDFASY